MRCILKKRVACLCDDLCFAAWTLYKDKKVMK